MGDPKWFNWSLGSPWLSQHLYEQYRFTGDKDYLRNVAYPLIKGAADDALGVMPVLGIVDIHVPAHAVAWAGASRRPCQHARWPAHIHTSLSGVPA